MNTRAFAARALLALLICEALAVAYWLIPASAHIVQWPESGPTRLALFAPLWHLYLLVPAAAAIAAATLWRGVDVSRFTPLLAVWLWTVPFLPWLPDRLPLLLVLGGPLRWVVLLAAIAACVARPGWLAGIGRFADPPRAWVFAFSLAIFSAAGLWAVSTHGLVGDEPHYLVIDESLLRDRDLQIENNHIDKDYRSFFFGELRPDYMQRGTNGQIYSIHAPGLPVLTLPAYAAGGYRGVVVFMALIAALTVLAIFDLARTVAGPAAATLTVLATCATVPFVPYAWSIFPEMPGAWIVAYSARWLWEEERRSARHWMIRGAALGLLPWVHTRFVIFSAVFGAAFAWRLLRRPRAFVAFVLPAVIAGVLWLYSFYVIYGIWSPEAPYGAYADEFVRMRYIVHGLIGILFDQKFGLLFYSPIYLLAPIGAWWLMRETRSRWPTLVLLAAAGAYVGSTVRLYMFWGGASAPARFLVPIVPCLAPLVAVAISRVRSRLLGGLIPLWMAASLAISAFSMLAPGRFVLYSEPHGRARILEIVQAGSPLALVVPTFTDPDWAMHLAPFAVWMAIGLVSLLVGVALATRRWMTAYRLAAVTSACFIVGGAFATATPSAEIRRATAQRGVLEWLAAYDGARSRLATYRPLAKTTFADAIPLATLSLDPETPRPEDGRVAGPITVPPGRYEARVWFNSTAERRGVIRVGTLSGATFATQEGLLANPVVMPFDAPFAVGRLTVSATDAVVAADVTRVEIGAVDVVPASDRDPSPIHAVESLPRSGAFIAYTDEWSYPERGTFWTRGQARARVLIAPAGASRVVLFFSTGPRDSQVTWQAGNDAPRVTAVPANQEVTVAVPVMAGASIVPLVLSADTEFRPGDVNPQSTDMRRLGVRVRIELE